MFEIMVQFLLNIQHKFWIVQNIINLSKTIKVFV